MLFLTIMHHYLLWHYTKAFGEIAHISKNFFWFTIHFFSLPQLIRSFFSPWKRMTEERGDTFNFEDLAGFVIINILSRLVGMMLRTSIIILGFIALLVVLICTIVTYVFWVMAPAALLVCLILGITLLFS
ncbi:hypothetical protein A3I99_04485 [Candidatus Kaiserbacteria bacterium RIFCSPLOWO2_02_FULL_45_11b]|uniref:Uncharacterized protein n=1 Tax=Candidatus Kaiserbacteria bacterium RIFCSPLOWO2_12_FULL_45_26 TaxID=1798525 RepID=A0A1F6FFH1_9BACT|nr:MAG: hypothetical protein A2Z56_00455 [Candidatus Kaiserbacteria bacterium RIFCSPHIGHO2_12_45_16]OGG69527.1 MAG: hypothetical protein A2929_03105 [Candidatus Kaiserbacteria bacterium RIFCSPLOWO2_01_FULL_45_25]OGG84341.1 MAG: hypothetical protein A3I99_04485 [Candidatus Kaiserbacteria bacterium RIFCSPLOWO2_02_FULL_45_11b]OGG84613.1 MAG: hypothetical protein A3G90_00795 [Candidatus Kaiserbacteria bacterium RIFCSPLOWO2_12_FULL_45_26]